MTTRGESPRKNGRERRSDDLDDLRPRRRPLLLAGYGLVILWIVAGFLAQLAQGQCPVP